MKKMPEKGFLAIAIALLFCSAPLTLIAQQNTIIVTDAKGDGIKGATVIIFEGTTGKCNCVLGICSMPSFDAVLTNDKGRAEFRNKAKPFNPGTTYAAYVNCTCSSSNQQQQCTKDGDCHFVISAGQPRTFVTDKNKNFAAITIIQ